MTKAELVDQISHASGQELPAPSIASVIEHAMKIISTAVAEGETVTLRGFGSFELKHRAAKSARNLKTGAAIIIPAHTVPAFKPAKEFVARVKDAHQP